MATVTVKTIPLSSISLSDDFQGRDKQLDEDHIEQMVETYREWVADGGECPIPKPVVFMIGAVYHTVSGYHRVTAMRRAGIERAEFEVHAGVSKSDAHVYASQSNLEHNALPPSRACRKKSLLMFYDNVIDAKLLADGALAKRFKVSRTTVSRWLKEHDKGRASQTERVGSDGRSVRVDTSAKPKADKPDTTLFDGGETPPAQSAGQGGSTGEAPSPEKTPAKARAGDEYPPDRGFMPNAEEAEKICATFASVKARMDAIRSELAKLLPDPSHPIANRLHLQSEYVGRLKSMADDLTANTPSHTCPRCAGTAEVDGKPCRECNGYGLVSAADAASGKGWWKKGSADKYDRLAKYVILGEEFA